MTSPAADPSPACVPNVERLLAEGAWLRALARSLVVDAAAADDLAQDATVVALTTPPREAGALRGWLRRVVRNLAANAHRGDVRREARETAGVRERAADDPAEVVARWEIRRQVVDAVLALDEPYRTTLLLRFFEGLEVAEVAARVGVPVDTVKTRQRRALDVLRARLAHLDDRAGRRGLAVLLVLARSGDGGGAGGSASTASAASHAPTVAVPLGGLAMSALVKSLATVAVLATIGAAVWVVRLDDGARSGAAAPGPSRGTSDASAAHAGRAKRPTPAAQADVAPPVLPADLAAFAGLDPDRDLHGIVVDRDDRPVAGAHVTSHRFDALRYVMTHSRGMSPALGPETASADSAADGSFRLRLAAGSDTLLTAHADGFADVEVPFLVAGQAVKVVLSPATALRVRVVGEGGAPVAGAAVTAESAEGGGTRVAWIRGGVTDAGGAVAWDGLPRGREAKARIDVQPELGHAPARADVALEDRDVNETAVTLAAGRTIEGRVVDAETNAAVASARIAVDERRPPVAVTDADGRFGIDGWDRVPRWRGDPECRVVASADGYAPTWAKVPEPDTRGGASPPIEIALRRGFGLTGFVATADGTPAADARLAAFARDPSGRDQVVVDTATDERGAFHLGALPRGAKATLVVAAHGCALRTIVVAPPPKSEATLDLGTIVVAPGRTVRGRVVDADGAGVSDRRVRLRDGAGDTESEGFAPTRRTSDDGRFAFAKITPGRHRAVVLLPTATGPWREEGAAEILVPPDADPEPTTIVLRPPPPGPPPKVVLRTRVTDEDGRPLAGVRLGVNYVAGGWSGVVKSGDGGALDVPCAEEPQFLSTRMVSNDPTSPHDPAFEELTRRYLYSHVWIRPGRTTADIVLRRGEPVSGTVVDAAGKPVVQVWVEALVGGKQVGFGYTDAQGRFAFAVPRGATVDLEARPQSGDYPPPPDVGVRRGVAAGSSDVAIRVETVALDRALDVVLVPPEGVALGKCDLYADFHGADNRHPVRATFDRAGRAHLDGLPRAPVQLRVTMRLADDPEGTATGVSPVRVPADETTARIVVPSFRFVRGRVVDESGAPSPKAYLFSTASMTASSVHADEQGRFALRVPADAEVPFLVTATRTPFDREHPQRGWEVVEDASDAEIEIVVRPVPPQ